MIAIGICGCCHRKYAAGSAWSSWIGIAFPRPINPKNRMMDLGMWCYRFTTKEFPALSLLKPLLGLQPRRKLYPPTLAFPQLALELFLCLRRCAIGLRE